jgi:hypothetical protein
VSLIDVADVTTETIRVSTTAESATPLPTASNVARHGLPAVVNRAQAYYWTHAWQRDEAESMRDVERGDVMTFRDGRSAVTWLLSGDAGDH